MCNDGSGEMSPLQERAKNVRYTTPKIMGQVANCLSFFICELLIGHLHEAFSTSNGKYNENTVDICRIYLYCNNNR